LNQVTLVRFKSCNGSLPSSLPVDCNSPEGNPEKESRRTIVGRGDLCRLRSSLTEEQKEAVKGFTQSIDKERKARQIVR